MNLKTGDVDKVEYISVAAIINESMWPGPKLVSTYEERSPYLQLGSSMDADKALDGTSFKSTMGAVESAVPQHS